MTTAANKYSPDYAVPPGWVIEEHLATHGISQAELARRCGRSPKLISEIIAGRAPIEPGTALQFEMVLGVDASIWLGIEADYQLFRAREADARRARDLVAWAKTFPARDLVKRGAMDPPSSESATVQTLLSFFGVATKHAWDTKYGAAQAAYRHSPSFESDQPALKTWLRLVELDAERQNCGSYDEPRFRSALRQVRSLTRDPMTAAIRKARELCAETGVALAVVDPLPKVRLSGAAWWYRPGKPVIALTGRHKSDDHLWFSFFHEAAHLLLHSRREIFIDDLSPGGDDIEAQANVWAANFLLPRQHWRQFVANGVFGSGNVQEFAQEQGIAPGIVVGRLQHEKLVPWNQLNHLKKKAA
ncbi:MAG: ImmA/IrrE family metallo-endopeptidase [Gammaproteobacteria bacterium]|nr:ImmA/IrrE family metallo-endopeptidase [Gammaproteobacteria bacterium]MDE0475150.1 ImmA/IrrE family metallo-endopeptidase [Gammaproteobacteria bacterium]MDE0648883.1 ImmA/IrrE family metallo-endopeptidase [Gammaproteobacteria bacterium]MXY30732.1 ImmA/IrrE family metallo-endopeptidase [Gammaproteobacteria bacterium]MYC98394.1 ImmA/IrrE family metallo-endopeptidase [Gammaproteobacteria bacterium]